MRSQGLVGEDAGVIHHQQSRPRDLHVPAVISDVSVDLVTRSSAPLDVHVSTHATHPYTFPSVPLRAGTLLAQHDPILQRTCGVTHSGLERA